MSRDFIGSTPGRSFKKSPNRDRITRGVAHPYYPSIAFLKTRWGAYDWCLTGSAAQINAGSLTRYRKIRLTYRDGERIDEIDFGDGRSDPTHQNIASTPALAGGMPLVFPNQFVGPAPTATVAYGAQGGSPSRLMKFELLEPESLFVEEMIEEAYDQFAALTEFRTVRNSAGNFLDRAHWSEGPITIRTVDGFAKGSPLNTDRLAIADPALRYVANGEASDALGLNPDGSVRPPGDGSYCGLLKILNLNTGGLPSASTPGLLAGCARLGAQGMQFGGYGFWLGLTKTYIKREQAGTFYLKQPTSLTGARTQVYCEPAMAIPAGVLQPPPSDFMMGAVGSIVSAYAFPPWSVAGNSFLPPPLPSCFTVT